jgi:hypothetical protein
MGGGVVGGVGGEVGGWVEGGFEFARGMGCGWLGLKSSGVRGKTRGVYGSRSLMK